MRPRLGCVNLTLPLVPHLGFSGPSGSMSRERLFMPANTNVDSQNKMKDKYDELRAAIAAVRKVNADFLDILPAKKGECGDETSPPRLAETVAAFFRDHGQEAEEAIAAFLDARARFSFEEFPRNWPEVYYMVYSSRRIMWRLHRRTPCRLRRPRRTVHFSAEVLALPVQAPRRSGLLPVYRIRTYQQSLHRPCPSYRSLTFLV